MKELFIHKIETFRIKTINLSSESDKVLQIIKKKVTFNNVVVVVDVVDSGVRGRVHVVVGSRLVPARGRQPELRHRVAQLAHILGRHDVTAAHRHLTVTTALAHR